MVGLGKWKFFIDTMFYRGDAFLRVAEKDGAYDISIEVPGEQLPKLEFFDLVPDGATVTGNVRTDMLKGKDIPFSVTFEGDKASGFIKVPFIGKIRLDNGERID